MRASAAADIFRLVRSGVDVRTIHSQTKKPFRFLLCGDPGLVAELRALLLRGNEGHDPQDAAATLETVDASRPTIISDDVRAVIFLGRGADASGADLERLRALRAPVFALTVDPSATPSAPASKPDVGNVGYYVVGALDAAQLRVRFFTHIADVCVGVEVAVARRLPALRESCAAKLTRDAAKRALTMAAASAVVDHVPVIGVVLGAFTSAGDMLAITGVQMVLMLQIGACYGKDPDLQRMWELLPVVGGGFGWRALSRELAGFIPVAGIAIKGAIAYAGTIVVGEGVNFYYLHGRHMNKSDAASLYEETKASAMTFARDVFKRIRKQ